MVNQISATTQAQTNVNTNTNQQPSNGSGASTANSNSNSISVPISSINGQPVTVTSATPAPTTTGGAPPVNLGEPLSTYVTNQATIKTTSTPSSKSGITSTSNNVGTFGGAPDMDLGAPLAPGTYVTNQATGQVTKTALSSTPATISASQFNTGISGLVFNGNAFLGTYTSNNNVPISFTGNVPAPTTPFQLIQYEQNPKAYLTANAEAIAYGQLSPYLNQTIALIEAGQQNIISNQGSLGLPSGVTVKQVTPYVTFNLNTGQVLSSFSIITQGTASTGTQAPQINFGYVAAGSTLVIPQGYGFSYETNTANYNFFSTGVTSTNPLSTATSQQGTLPAGQWSIVSGIGSSNVTPISVFDVTSSNQKGVFSLTPSKSLIASFLNKNNDETASTSIVSQAKPTTSQTLYGDAVDIGKILYNTSPVAIGSDVVVAEYVNLNNLSQSIISQSSVINADLLSIFPTNNAQFAAGLTNAVKSSPSYLAFTNVPVLKNGTPFSVAIKIPSQSSESLTFNPNLIYGGVASNVKPLFTPTESAIVDISSIAIGQVITGYALVAGESVLEVGEATATSGLISSSAALPLLRTGATQAAVGAVTNIALTEGISIGITGQSASPSELAQSAAVGGLFGLVLGAGSQTVALRSQQVGRVTLFIENKPIPTNMGEGISERTVFSPENYELDLANTPLDKIPVTNTPFTYATEGIATARIFAVGKNVFGETITKQVDITAVGLTNPTGETAFVEGVGKAKVTTFLGTDNGYTQLGEVQESTVPTGLTREVGGKGSKTINASTNLIFPNIGLGTAGENGGILLRQTLSYSEESGEAEGYTIQLLQNTNREAYTGIASLSGNKFLANNEGLAFPETKVRLITLSPKESFSNVAEFEETFGKALEEPNLTLRVKGFKTEFAPFEDVEPLPEIEYLSIGKFSRKLFFEPARGEGIPISEEAKISEIGNLRIIRDTGTGLEPIEYFVAGDEALSSRVIYLGGSKAESTIYQGGNIKESDVFLNLNKESKPTETTNLFQKETGNGETIELQLLREKPTQPPQRPARTLMPPISSALLNTAAERGTLPVFGLGLASGFIRNTTNKAAQTNTTSNTQRVGTTNKTLFDITNKTVQTNKQGQESQRIFDTSQLLKQAQTTKTGLTEKQELTLKENTSFAPGITSGLSITPPPNKVKPVPSIPTFYLNINTRPSGKLTSGKPPKASTRYEPSLVGLVSGKTITSTQAREKNGGSGAYNLGIRYPVRSKARLDTGSIF